jgi:hypothetical protein
LVIVKLYTSDAVRLPLGKIENEVVKSIINRMMTIPDKTKPFHDFFGPKKVKAMTTSGI